MEHNPQAGRRGLAYALGAYGWWGLIPLYFRQLDGVPPPEVLAHRVLWSFLVLAALVTALRRWGDVLLALRSRAIMLRLLASTTLIGANWLTYIYAVSTHQVVQASLGYFLTPLVSVLLGVGVLGERLRRLQMVALNLATLGVLSLAVVGGQVPWIAMVLATSFATYGLIRKTVGVDGLLGLLIETMILLPASIACIASWENMTTATAFTIGGRTLYWLAAGGVVTTVPLLLFGAAARRLRLVTLGILQYLSPTLQFVVALVVFGEKLTHWQYVSFGCVLSGIVIYCFDSWRVWAKANA